MKHFIENEFIRLGCETLGGCLCSIFDKRANEELLYQKEEGSWQGQDVAIFPFIARLKNKTYTYEGKSYELRNHGICRYYEFQLIEKDDASMKLALRSNEDTLKECPFPFLFIITYRLVGQRVEVVYEVKNEGEKAMPFGIGAHPAFIVDGDGKGDTDGNFVVFDKPAKLTRIKLDEKGEFVIGKEDFGTLERIETTKKIIRDYKTLCVEGDGIDHITLLRKNGRKLSFTYDNIRYLVLWSFPDSGNFVAIEPWMSLPDFADAPLDIEKKETLLKLAGGKSYRFSYKIDL